MTRRRSAGEAAIMRASDFCGQCKTGLAPGQEKTFNPGRTGCQNKLASGLAEELVQHPSYEVEAVWRSLAQEVQDRVRLGFEQGGFLRTFVHPLAHGATSRMGRLRAYGDAINAQVAKAFVESVMEVVA
jgi:hypothetical protein